MEPTLSPKVSLKRRFAPEGWVTVIAAFFIHFLHGHAMGTMGILLVEFVEYFGCTKGEVAMVGAIQASLFTLGALLFGEVLARIGCKRTGALGTILVVAGYGGGALCHSVPGLCLTIGLLAGLGYSCFILVANVAVQRHCSEWRALAAGLAIMGNSIDILVFPMWTQYLIRQFNWRAAVLINAGITLHALPLSMLLTPWRGSQEKLDLQMKRERTSVGQDTEMESFNVITPDAATHVKENVCDKSSEEASTSQSLKSEMVRNEGSRNAKIDNGCDGLEKIDVALDTAEGKPSTYSAKQAPWKHTLSIYISILKQPHIVLYILSTGLIHYGHSSPLIYLPMRSASLNIGKAEVAALLSTLGVIVMFGRAGAGVLGNCVPAHRILFYSVSGISTGCASALSILFYNNTGLFVYAFAYGICSGPYMSYMSVVPTDLVGIRKLPQLLTLTWPVIGFLQMVSVSTAGMLLDYTSDTSIPFVYMGSMQAFGGFLSLIVWKLDKRSKDITI